MATNEVRGSSLPRMAQHPFLALQRPRELIIVTRSRDLFRAGYPYPSPRASVVAKGSSTALWPYTGIARRYGHAALEFRCGRAPNGCVRDLRGRRVCGSQFMLGTSGDISRSCCHFCCRWWGIRALECVNWCGTSLQPIPSFVGFVMADI